MQGFDELLNFNLAEHCRVQLTGQTQMSTVLDFVEAEAPGRLHRIYGWIRHAAFRDVITANVAFSASLTSEPANFP